MLSDELPLAKAEAHISANIHRLSTTALDCLPFFRQSFTLTVLKRVKMPHVDVQHSFNT